MSRDRAIPSAPHGAAPPHRAGGVAAVLPGEGDARARGRSALVDTHCHVDLFPDPAAVVREAEAAGVYVVAVTTTPSVFRHLCDILRGARYVRPALGLHPELARERERELPLFERHLADTRYVGEIGLDHVTTDHADRAAQRRVLDAVLRACDAAANKVLTVHSRRAADDVVDAFGVGFRGTWILHWYSGSIRALERALANGAYVSANPAMTRSATGARVLAACPRDRMLTETDGPFVTAGPRPIRPPDVADAVAGLARVWNVDDEVARAQVYANFDRVVRTAATPPRA